MPRAVSRRFTDKDRDKVEKFMKALLDHEKHDPKIKAEWRTANPEPYHLVVETTKENLVWVIYDPNCAGDDFKKYKPYIQTAMAYLEEDLKILVRQSTKRGADAKNLEFYLRLPSQNIEEIFQKIFLEKWTARRQEFEPKTSQSREVDVKIDVELVVVGVEGGIIKYAVKFKGSPDAMRISQKKIHQYVRDMAEDPTIELVSMREGCVIVEFQGSLEGFKRLESKIKSGEITEILGFPILDIQQIEELDSSETRDIGFKLTQWFDNIKVDDWLYDIGMQAAKLALKSYQNLTGNIGATAPTTLRGTPTPVTPIIDSIFFSGLRGAAAFWRGNNPSQANRLEGLEALTSNTSQSSLSLTDLIDDVLNSNNKYSILMSAYELCKLLENVSNIPQGLINFLANRITTIEDSETRWQLALTLGKLDPEHPLGAVGQTKTIEFPTDDWFDLFLALRVGEDDLIDVLIEVTSATDEYLPVGLQVSLLDETEEIFSEVVAKEEERYLSLEFTGAIGQFFSVKLSLGDNYLIDNFVI